ncbi:MAG: cysteine--tRNA ligase [Candidatus Kerfeldbacteria bacterium CG_4_10_14_0_8_um_filter_42_10]|uniref:Cysteine--tRNA ligase n=1 Tax=Candidatus Kerfeldbacteria bacterium CG_4_10_14_0_8_um_filter_42_10 TaxID=2014248 RepID=A0A2M7RJA7_9BACT|nr:MAG: cysteine--tRNA ligase [Candidatus Kerfeldbacteria bacterium CG_4_10_14_0_8_um_filter_42_10]
MTEICFYNTLARKKEGFKPIKKGLVGLYTCGPTVYNYAHIGNLRTYVFEDVLRRTLEYNGLKVKHVMNITDVGHLTSDADTGEDKVEKEARKENKSAWDITDYYAGVFKKNLQELNIKPPAIWCKATDHIKEQIALVKKLEKKGFTYRTGDGIYFNTAKLKDYGKLARLDVRGLKAGARVALKDEKKNLTDFALWKFSPKDSKRQMEWDSPWGLGFPGWHLECSAMSTKYLGQPFDLHTGGVDHISVHHTNEIAQSEAANGKTLANYWLHGEFLIIQDQKMAKSEQNFITLATLKNKGINPIAYRYLILTSHYRSKLNFSWKSLAAAESALKSIYHQVEQFDNPKVGCAELEQKFIKAINNDLDTPQAVAILWELLKSNYPTSAKKKTLLEFDRVLGLGLDQIEKQKLSLPKAVSKLAQARENARKKQDFSRADSLRKEIEKLGFKVEDTKDGLTITKKD